MNFGYTDEQHQKIAECESEVSWFKWWTLGTLSVAAILAVVVVKTNNIIALGGVVLSVFALGHCLNNFFIALNSRDKARGYGNSRMYPYYGVIAMAVAVFAYLYLRNRF